MDFDSNKWILIAQQVEKGNATSGKEKNATGVFWQILELVRDTGD